MATNKDNYETLRLACEKQLRETGKIEHKLREDKRQAFQAAFKDQIAENRKGKIAAQEVYVARFPDSEQPKVRERLAAAVKGSR